MFRRSSCVAAITGQVTYPLTLCQPHLERGEDIMAHGPYAHPARLTLSVARISWLTAASNPLVGSSRKRMEGRATSSSPMLTRLRCPPLMPACEGGGEGDQQKAGFGTIVLPAACDGWRDKLHEAGAEQLGPW